MSMAEFYIENCIDPTDPHHMDRFLEMHSGPSESYVSGVDAVQRQVLRDASSRSEASSWPLNESELDYMGDTRGWDKVEGVPAQPPMTSYKKDGVRLNFWLSTGTVGSYLDHPRQGKTQLFRRSVSMSEASEVFDDPRKHTGKGYHTKAALAGNKREAERAPATPMRTCARCGKSKSNENYSNTQRRKGASSKCKACVKR